MSTQNHPAYILKRPSGLYFRIKVPADVRQLIGKTELRRSLAHLSEKAAHREALRLSVMAYYLFENARNQSNHPQINQFDGLLATKDWKSISNPLHRSSSSYSTEPDTPILTDMIRAYIEEQIQAGNWTAKTEHENRAILKLLSRIIGDPRCCDLSYELLRKYKNTLIKLPPNLNKNPKYKDKSFNELAAMDAYSAVT